MDVEAKFISLDQRESFYERVDMPCFVVFYPYFRYSPLKSCSGGVCRAYRVEVELKDFSLDKLAEFESRLYSGRHNEYGFWTAKAEDGFFYIGLGVKSLPKFLGKNNVFEVVLAMLYKTDLLYILRIKKTSSGFENPKLTAYFSDVNSSYMERIASIKKFLEEIGFVELGIDLKAEVVEYSCRRYTYCRDGDKPEKLEPCQVVFPCPEPAGFVDNVHGCIWHTIVFNDNVINEGPRFVLLRRPEQRLGNVVDELSYILVHRRGGFVMGREFASNDFHQETTYTLREVYVYMFGDVTILDIECDTYTRNRDEGLDRFLRGLNEIRFRH